jgi:predicted nucleic acid-binding protein
VHERFLLDTNALIAGRRRDLALIVRLAFADSIAIPSVALGELFSGAYRSDYVASNVAYC